MNIDDLQAVARRARAAGAVGPGADRALTARLESETLDATTRAQLEARLKTLRSELRQLRRDTAATTRRRGWRRSSSSVVTPGVLGAVPVPSRLDRTLDEALNVLVWEASSR